MTSEIQGGDPGRARVLLRRGRVLEGITLGWNVAGVVVLAMAAVAARSVALAGFGLDSLIEIGASTVVLWALAGPGEERQRRALRLIGAAFLALAAYLAVQSADVSRTSAYRRWPHKDLFFSDLVLELARDPAPGIVADEMDLIRRVLGASYSRKPVTVYSRGDAGDRGGDAGGGLQAADRGEFAAAGPLALRAACWLHGLASAAPGLRRGDPAARAVSSRQPGAGLPTVSAQVRGAATARPGRGCLKLPAERLSSQPGMPRDWLALSLRSGSVTGRRTRRRDLADRCARSADAGDDAPHRRYRRSQRAGRPGFHVRGRADANSMAE